MTASFDWSTDAEDNSSELVDAIVPLTKSKIFFFRNVNSDGLDKICVVGQSFPSNFKQPLFLATK